MVSSKLKTVTHKQKYLVKSQFLGSVVRGNHQPERMSSLNWTSEALQAQDGVLSSSSIEYNTPTMAQLWTCLWVGLFEEKFCLQAQLI